MPDVLVVDDDPHLREVVSYALSRAGFGVRTARDGLEALREVDRKAPDLVVLDVLMPELDGLETCRRLRAKGRLPIVFLSSRDEEIDRVLGLEMGGDDYLTKPFSPRELVARVKAVLRRAAPPADEAAPGPVALEAGGLRLDLVGHRCFVGPAEVPLTVTEFAILEALMARPGRAFTREDLVDRAYGEGHHLADRTLDSHIRRIRHKLREHGLDPIETVHGLGYRFGG
jgi:two-component system OmpR family response regulator